MNAEIPIFAQWDDHEVTNNWWPEEPLDRAEHQRKKYTEKNMLTLAARGARAFHEYMPIRATLAEVDRVYRKLAYGPLLDVIMLDTRSYRGPNAENMEESYGPSAYFFAPRAGRLAQARAEGLAGGVEGDRLRHAAGAAAHLRRRPALGPGIAVAGRHGPPRGREHELADILSFIKRERIRNTIWITADVHYAAAHYFDPNKAAFQDFEPFWEFVAGPLNAGTGRPIPPDGTFGPQVVFAKGAPRGSQRQSRPELRHAVLRPRRDRRRDRGDDGDAQGHRRQRAVVEQARAEEG